MTRSGLSLTHATRVLEALGHADPNSRGAIVDRQSRLWWFELAGHSYPRFNLSTYDHLYEERLGVLRAHDEWAESRGRVSHHRPTGTATAPTVPTRPTARTSSRKPTTCPSCALRPSINSSCCASTASTRGPSSLVSIPRSHGALVTPPSILSSRTEPKRSWDAASTNWMTLFTGPGLANARAHCASSAPSDIGCPTADVEVDVDMESYDDTTYLWGAFVTLNVPTDGVSAGYRSFVEWADLTPDAETRIFSEFWSWLSEIREHCRAQGRSFAAYCFWAAAEDGAMNRAVANPSCRRVRPSTNFSRFVGPIRRRGSISTNSQSDRFRPKVPSVSSSWPWAAGFHWRDANPSGEASMVWYEVASRDDSPTALASRERIVTYNEDDCRATKALRDWLNGPARSLPHRDDVL